MCAATHVALLLLSAMAFLPTASDAQAAFDPAICTRRSDIAHLIEVDDGAMLHAVNFHRHGGSLEAQQAVWNRGSMEGFDPKVENGQPHLPMKPQDRPYKHLRACWPAADTRNGASAPAGCFFDVLGPIVARCRGGMTSIGNADQEKRFCMGGSKPSNRSRSGSGGRSRKARVLFSIGSFDSWDFEKGAMLLGAFDRIHVFDCTLPGDGLPKLMPPELRPHVRFHPWCLGATTHIAESTGRRFGSYVDLWRLTGEDAPPELVKMDIEGWEWEILPTLLASGQAHLLPLQIAVEVHAQTYRPALKVGPKSFWRTKTPGEVAALMAKVFAMGFVLIDRRDNALCQHCTEIVLYNLCAPRVHLAL